MQNQQLKTFNIVKTSPKITVSDINAILRHYSTVSTFHDDKWILDLRDINQNKKTKYRTIYFGSYKNEFFLNEVKSWASKLIVRKYSTLGISGIIGSIRLLSDLVENNSIHSFTEITPIEISKLHTYLFIESQNTTKRNLEKWNNIRKFFIEMEFYDQYYMMEKFVIPKFPKGRCFEDKYIPDYISNQLDVILKKENIPHALRTFYWILRLIPNRVTEVASMKTSCLKPISEDSYILTISTPKQSGPYESSMLKLIEIQDAGIGSYLISLIKKQIEFTKEQNPSMRNNDFLFYSNSFRYYKKNKELHIYDKVILIDSDFFAYFLKRICTVYDVKDEQGNIFNPMSHQFRHNAVSDRMNSGIFRAIDIKPLTGHHTTAMIEQTYTHTHIKDIKKDSPIVFRGRIINTDDEDRMNRLLAKPFSRRIHNLGICSDSRSCNKSKSQCLRCDYLLPDFDNLSFYEYDQNEWRSKKIKAEQVGNVDYADLCQDWIDSYEVAIKRVLHAITDESFDTKLEGNDEADQ